MAFASAASSLGAFGCRCSPRCRRACSACSSSDLLQALPLYVLMGALLNRLPLAQVLYRDRQSRAVARTGAAPPLAGLGLGVLLAPMNGSVGASVAMLSRTVLPRLDAAGIAPARGAALVCVASTLGVVMPPSLVLILLGDAMLRAHTEAVNVTHAVGAHHQHAGRVSRRAGPGGDPARAVPASSLVDEPPARQADAPRARADRARMAIAAVVPRRLLGACWPRRDARLPVRGRSRSGRRRRAVRLRRRDAQR